MGVWWVRLFVKILSCLPMMMILCELREISLTLLWRSTTLVHSGSICANVATNFDEDWLIASLPRSSQPRLQVRKLLFIEWRTRARCSAAAGQLQRGRWGGKTRWRLGAFSWQNGDAKTRQTTNVTFVWMMLKHDMHGINPKLVSRYIYLFYLISTATHLTLLVWLALIHLT